MKNIVLLSFLALLNLSQVKAQDHSKGYYNQRDGVAINGYDPVAYFTKNEAIQGIEKYNAEDNGITYYFANQEHKKLFVENPTKYKPEYGGWCAYAIGDSGEKVDVNPKTFKIVIEKLYLFYNTFPVNTLNKWNKKEAVLKREADKNWKSEKK